MGRSNQDERGAAGRLNRWWLLVFPVVILLLGTLIFRVSDADLVAGGAFFDGQAGWQWKDFPIFEFLYHYGVQPALILSALALVVLALGFCWVPARRWRKIAGYYLLVVVIGPGILINAVLKEHWGRPRPREVTEFGGKERFEKVWEYDSSSPGKSFPSGHASMGFCLFALYFIGRALRKSWARWAGFGALVLGASLGLARVAQGGHFASDVLWSAGICYFVALAFYRLLGLGERPFYEGRGLSRAGWFSVAGILVAAGLLAVAVPFEEEKHLVGREGVAVPAAGCDIRVELPRAELRVVLGERFGFRSHVEGFGSLGSRLIDRFEESVSDSGYRIRLRQRRRGLLATSEQPAELEVPAFPPGKVQIEVGEGSVSADLFPGRWDWGFEVEDGDLTLRVPAGQALKVVRQRVGGEVTNEVPGLEWSEEKGRWRRGESPAVRVRVDIGGDLKLLPLGG